MNIYKTIICLLILSLSGSPSASEQIFYYVRLDYKYINSIEKDKNLLMIPLGEDFRYETFKKAKTRGLSHQTDNADVHAYAEHNAIENLLYKEGLKSITSKETVINAISYTETVMSYEGAVKYPYTLLTYGFNENNLYEVQLEVEFSPVESPEKWKSLYIKDKIKHAYSNILSIFK